MGVLEGITARAKADRKHIVLAEGPDPRIIEAGLRAVSDDLADITLLGPVDAIRSRMDSASPQMNIIDPAAPDVNARYASHYYNLRRHKNIAQEAAHDAARDPLNFANLMVSLGEADGSVAGAIHTTTDVVRSALQVIGLGQSRSRVSSLFLMVMPEPSHHLKDGAIFSDCGLMVDPDAKQLAEIAAMAADNAAALLGLEPKVAMLSFSTHQSATHASVDKVRTATDLLRQHRPDLIVDGDIQFDAALVPKVAASKAPDSTLQGQANVFIFPDLNAGNIGYKIAQRLGGAVAIGPVLQGLAKPANDLSRGCSSDDVYNMIAVTALQAQMNDAL